jgi:hypothetical protein
MVRGETTIAMTPSSRKSMVAQFFENETTEDQISQNTIEIVEEDEAQIQGTVILIEHTYLKIEVLFTI